MNRENKIAIGILVASMSLSMGYVVLADVATTAVTVGNAAPTLSVNFNGGNSITLTEATYTWATATLTITDGNGCSTIDDVEARAILASTTVASSSPCTANDNSCYITGSSTSKYTSVPGGCYATTTGNTCTGGNDTSVVYDCGFKFWYIARATDSGAPTWASSIWAVVATTSDSYATTTASNTSQTVEINTLAALDLTPAISYGTLSANSDTGSTNSTTTATTTGNIAIDGNISGNASYMESGLNQIHISKQKYNASPFTYSSGGTKLTSTSTPRLEFSNNNEPTSTTSPITQDVSWGIAIEAGQANGTYTGSSTVAAVAD